MKLGMKQLPWHMLAMFQIRKGFEPFSINGLTDSGRSRPNDPLPALRR